MLIQFVRQIKRNCRKFSDGLNNLFLSIACFKITFNSRIIQEVHLMLFKSVI